MFRRFSFSVRVAQDNSDRGFGRMRLDLGLDKDDVCVGRTIGVRIRGYLLGS